MRQPEGFSDIGAFYRDILSKESIFPFSTFDRPFKEIEGTIHIRLGAKWVNSERLSGTGKGHRKVRNLLLASAVNSVHCLGLGHKGKPNGMPMPEDMKPHVILEKG